MLRKAVPGGPALRAPVPETVSPAALPFGRRRLRRGARPPHTRHRACTSDRRALAVCSSPSADGIMGHIFEGLIAYITFCRSKCIAMTDLDGHLDTPDVGPGGRS